MELYWDQIFFTVDEPPAEVRTTELPLVSADLHERGYSRVVRDDSNGPEQFLYDEVSTEPKWPPMLGRFTRLGDVRELLTKRDDRLLVMGAGDEVTLRFAVPAAPLPPGWKRDFMLYSAGWDKDANLETIVGQSSEPLPFQAMSGYPWPPTERRPTRLNTASTCGRIKRASNRMRTGECCRGRPCRELFRGGRTAGRRIRPAPARPGGASRRSRRPRPRGWPPDTSRGPGARPGRPRCRRACSAACSRGAPRLSSHRPAARTADAGCSARSTFSESIASVFSNCRHRLAQAAARRSTWLGVAADLAGPGRTAPSRAGCAPRSRG